MMSGRWVPKSIENANVTGTYSDIVGKYVYRVPLSFTVLPCNDTDCPAHDADAAVATEVVPEVTPVVVPEAASDPGTGYPANGKSSSHVSDPSSSSFKKKISSQPWVVTGFDKIVGCYQTLLRHSPIYLASSREDCEQVITRELEYIDTLLSQADGDNNDDDDDKDNEEDEKSARNTASIGLDTEWYRGGKVALMQITFPSSLTLLVKPHAYLCQNNSDAAVQQEQEQQQQEQEQQQRKPEGQALNNEDCTKIKEPAEASMQGKTPMSSALQTLLADPRIWKVGVGIKEDAKKLHNDWGLLVNGCIDISTVYSYHIEGKTFNACYSLAHLCKVLLGVELSKEKSVRCGNWGKNPLNDAQVLYGAADSFYSREAFVACYKAVLLREKESLASNDTTTSCSLPVGSLSLSAGTGVGGRQAATQRKSNEERGRDTAAGKAQEDRVRRQAMKISRLMSQPARKTPLYDNCKFVDKDMNFLFWGSKKKRDWYVKRNLATVLGTSDDVEATRRGRDANAEDEDKDVEDDTNKSEGERYNESDYDVPHIVVQLTFETKGKGNFGDKFYMEKKKNMCVVCGSEDLLVSYHVVPVEYRRHFDETIKNHSSHDVVLLCKRCHCTADAYVAQERKVLSEEARIAMHHPDEKQSLEKKELTTAKKAMTVLLKFKERERRAVDASSEATAVGDQAVEGGNGRGGDDEEGAGGGVRASPSGAVPDPNAACDSAGGGSTESTESKEDKETTSRTTTTTATKAAAAVFAKVKRNGSGVKVVALPEDRRKALEAPLRQLLQVWAEAGEDKSLATAQSFVGHLSAIGVCTGSEMTPLSYDEVLSISIKVNRLWEICENERREQLKTLPEFGFLVVRHYTGQDGTVTAFCERWRRLFLRHMRPQFLSSFWSVAEKSK